MTWKYRNKKQILIGVSSFIILSIIAILFIPKFNEEREKAEPKLLLEEKEEEENVNKKVENSEIVKVDIKGQVQVPGLYELTTNERVSDVIEAAGGLTEYADVSVINLSKKLHDEMVIIIYSAKEVLDFKKTKEVEKQSINKCIQPTDDSLRNDACIGSNEGAKKEVGMININTATTEELMNLPGIGEAKAKAILSYREENGPFTSIEEIKNVSGIGENVFANIAKNITT